MSCIAFGRIVSFAYEGVTSFGVIVLLGELFLIVVLILAHKKRKDEIQYF